MKIINTTIQNRTKGNRLRSTHLVPHHHTDTADLSEFLMSLRNFAVPKQQLLYSIGVKLLANNKNPAVTKLLQEYKFKAVEVPNIPEGIFDLLGSAYQYLNSKMENLKRGIFYTGKDLALQLTSDLTFDNGQMLMDPSCGSGSFLFHSEAPPEQLVGVDSDPIGVMIAKFNYFLKFPSAPPPQIYCSDFFAWMREHPESKFEYIIGNPPFGANLDISQIPSKYINSGESFSYFIEYSFGLLAKNGRLRFIVPESLLNVKRHTDIRDFILDQTNLHKIIRFSKKFTGVMSDMYMIELDKRRGTQTVFVDSSEIKMDRQTFRDLKNHIFVHLTDTDLNIIEKTNLKNSLNLSKSIFGLGVVTGNNADFLSDEPRKGFEPIYTGKEVTKYRLSSPKKYIKFDRDSLQQVAPDEIYRTPSKLIYKTICKTLRFALDESGSLTTNSANIVIPILPGYDATSVMAMLNSDLYSFLYIKLFGGVNKIGKEHLTALPFPKISASEQKIITKLTSTAIAGSSDEALQKFIHHVVFKLTDDEVSHVQEVVNSFR
jgi:tRNA1(Val) A37 N6-methylase TrmN6